MLYVSRLVSCVESERSKESALTRIGVVDTDDDSEEIVDSVTLSLAVKLGVQVEGVLSTEGYLYGVSPYRLPEYNSNAYQSKLALTGCNISVWKDMITSISWTCDSSVRLSDIAGSVADYVISDNNNNEVGLLTVVLDDNIKFTKTSFTPLGLGFLGRGCWDVRFDIRELTDASVIYGLLLASIDSGTSQEDFYASIIDRPERLELWRAEIDYLS